MAPQASLNTAEIADKARRDILHLLEGVRGKKSLVIEKSLAGPLGLYVKFSTLQEYGVDRVFFLENDNVDSSQKNVVFLARGEKSAQVFSIAEQIKRLRRNGQVDHDFSIFWVPRRTLVSDQILEEAGVLGEISISEYSLYFVPLAEDVLSLELENSFGDLNLHKDPTATFLAAKALMQIQQKHGLFPRIIGKGDNAKRLADLLLRMRSEVTASGGAGSSSLQLTPSASIESLIIIDREVDLPTVLLTQLTYEGLIDELFEISSNQVELDSSIVGAPAAQASQASSSTAPPPTQSLKRKMQLDNNDSLYSTLRDANCAVIGPMLSKVARRLQQTYDNRNTAGKTTSELREFVAKLPGYQQEAVSAKLHTNLAEEVLKHTRSDIFTRVLEVQQNIAAGADLTPQHDNIEELIARAASLPTVLRMLCLESTMNGGLHRRDLENFKRAIIHAYGHQHLLTLASLEKMGLLHARSGGGIVGMPGGKPGSITNYNHIRRHLHLIVDDVNESEPDDIAYVFSGYAPLSIRIVQCILQKQYLSSLSTTAKLAGSAALASAATGTTQGWRPFEETVKQIKGTTFDETQTGEERAVRARQMLNGSGHVEGGKTVVVFFLGGICRAEIAALRFVASALKEEGRGRRILICTTSVVTGNSVVGAAIEERSFGNN